MQYHDIQLRISLIKMRVEENFIIEVSMSSQQNRQCQQPSTTTSDWKAIALVV